MNADTTILVVDDTEATRYTLSRMLRSEGYVVHEAGTGADALREARARPDLIILDVRLPDANGYDVCRQIKSDPATSAIPVLHLSATFADSDSRSAGLEQGADGYLTYPVEPRELIANVKALLRTRRAERIARDQSELLRVTLASIGDAVIAADAQGRVTFLNPSAASLTGWSVAAAVGKPIDQVFQVMDEETRKTVATPNIQTAAAAVGSTKTQLILVAHDHSECPIEENISPIRDGEGNVIGVVIVFRDVTERRRAETALRESNRHKDEFLAMLAHELRNPLAPIRNALHILNVISPKDPPAVEARALIERQVEQLIRLVDDLLDVSRITRGLINLKKEVVDLSTVVNRAVESSRPLIDARRHVLQIQMPEGRLPVLADTVRLAQVLLNLLNNSAKYTPEGGKILLTVERTSTPSPGVRMRVRDTGMGIRAEMLPRIFDMFAQAERTLDRSDGGLGIGLTLVRRLTELHDGTVSVTSAGPGQGAEFVIYLPLAGVAQAPDAAQPSDKEAASPPSRRILVVDDNRDSADTLATLLRLFGNDVRTAYDGRQALAVAATYQPELVLLDLGLPGMDGIEVAKNLRTLPGQQKVVIVAMTGYGTDEDRRQTQAAGFNAHLVKPVHFAMLRELLSSSKLSVSC